MSADKPEIQAKFIDEFGLTFPMIADVEKTVIAAYGALKVLGVTAARKTFLIAPDGRIARIWPKVTVEGHAAEVLDALQEAQDPAS